MLGFKRFKSKNMVYTAVFKHITYAFDVCIQIEIATGYRHSMEFGESMY